MLENLKIENFRGFQSFELQQLGRVNLLVGQNNSGKTSILEAIQLLCSRNNLVLYGILSNRGEYSESDEGRGSLKPVEIRHLFYGHEFNLKSRFLISGKNGDREEKLIVSTEINSKLNNETYDDRFNDNSEEKLLSINIKWDNESNGESIERYLNRKQQGNNTQQEKIIDVTENKRKNIQFLTSSSLKASEMVQIFDKFVLKSEENIIQEAVKIIEPNIERIAAVSSAIANNKGGFFVLVSDNHQRLPIGSFGDGTWRMLGLALAIVNVKDGVLLVDEIDTGLHFTAMSKMWKLIWETAKRLNVQVFATTHNSDCWKSLASIACQENAHEEGGITIQRIEPDKPYSIAFNEREIVIAAERDLEVR